MKETPATIETVCTVEQIDELDVRHRGEGVGGPL